MNAKVLLAESLDNLKRGEQMEDQADRLQTQTAKSSGKKDFLAVKKSYSSAYEQYIKGLEMINFCRRGAIDRGEAELEHFCAQKMVSYMDKCDRLRDKETNILMSVEQADAMGGLDKEGYTPGDVVLMRRASEPLKAGTPLTFEKDLPDGSYQLTVKNYDDHLVATPVVTVHMQVTTRGGKTVRLAKVLPNRCAWSRFIGVVNSSKIQLRVASDGWVRDSKVEVLLRQLLPVEDDNGSGRLAFGGGPAPPGRPSNEFLSTLPGLPALPPPPPPQGNQPGNLGRQETPAPLGGGHADPNDPPHAFAAMGASQQPQPQAPMPPPPAMIMEPYRVVMHTAPPNASLKDRIDAAKRCLDSWPASIPDNQVAMGGLPPHEDGMLRDFAAAPHPTQLCGDIDLSDMDFNLDDADLM